MFAELSYLNICAKFNRNKNKRGRRLHRKIVVKKIDRSRLLEPNIGINIGSESQHQLAQTFDYNYISYL